MKILLINTVCGTGSTGHIVEDLYNSYTTDGHDVRVIFGRGQVNGVPTSNAVCFNTKIDFYYHCLMSRIFDSQGLHSSMATRKMIEFIKDFNPDLIHLHNIHGYYLNYKMLFTFLNSSKIKIVWTLHDCWAFTGHCAYYLYNKCSKWQTGCQKCKFKNDYPKSMVFDRSARNFRLKKLLFGSNKNLEIITPSNWLAKEVGKSFLNGSKVTVINNTIDTEVFKPMTSDIKNRLGIASNKKVILGVAMPWYERKGYQYFIDLAKVIDNENYQIVMVGLDEKQIQEIPKNIIGLKRTNSKEELAELYSMAYVFFNPTLEDNYPTVNLEALACGKPILCFSDTGGTEEIVGDNGIVLIDRSIDKVLEIIMKFDYK